MFVDLDRVSLLPQWELIGARNTPAQNGSISCKLEASDEFIYESVGTAQEPLPGPEGQIDNTVELDLLLRVAAIDYVLFEVRQPAPGFPGIRTGRPAWRRRAR